MFAAFQADRNHPEPGRPPPERPATRSSPRPTSTPSRRASPSADRRDRNPRHSRHPGVLQRFRDTCRGAGRASGRTRPRGSRCTGRTLRAARRRLHRGVHLVTLPTLRHEYLGAGGAHGSSLVHSFFQRYDVILVCNAANAVFTLWPRLIGTRVALNVDGHDRHRRKWSMLGRAWYTLSERLALWFPNAIVTNTGGHGAVLPQAASMETTRIAYGGAAARRGAGRAESFWAGAGTIYPLCEPARTGEQRPRRGSGLRAGEGACAPCGSRNAPSSGRSTSPASRRRATRASSSR